MNAFTRIVNRWVLAEEDEPNGFIQMRTPKNRMELRADFNNYALESGNFTRAETKIYILIVTEKGSKVNGNNEKHETNVNKSQRYGAPYQRESVVLQQHTYKAGMHGR